MLEIQSGLARKPGMLPDNSCSQDITRLKKVAPKVR